MTVAWSLLGKDGADGDVDSHRNIVKEITVIDGGGVGKTFGVDEDEACF